MGWRLKGNPRTVRVTRKLAIEFRDMEPAPHDRPLSERRLQVYERILRADHFRPLEWSRAVCTETNGVYRVNGKHTSTLLSGAETIPDNLMVTLYDYTCDTLEDVARLYSTFDSASGVRRAGDINASFAGTEPRLTGVPARFINAIVGGIAFRTHLGGYTSIPAAERAEAILDNVEFALFVHGIGSFSRESWNTYVRVPVVAAMYATYSTDAVAAATFWEAVRDETGSSPELPDRRLAKFLCFASSRASAAQKSHVRNRVTDRMMYVKCLHAWNAWRHAKTTNLPYNPKSGIPEVV